MELILDAPYPKQIEFFKANTKYIAYGGARGGGKSWSARTKAI
jgi:phage terminase large subunit